ncbi:MAG TPA: ABC transporter ATP-binding protein [Candidatus Limnocylindrales bacterium]
MAEGAGRRFGDVRAVDGLDLAVPPGTLLGLIGPSGSGKTTTIRMLTGQLRPTSGRLRVLGEDPMHFRRQTRERIGYMPQLFVLYPDLTAKENLDFVGSLFGMLWPRRRRRVREVLELVDLWPARDRRASALSGGMQRRLELACALVHDPVLLFLDEPTAGIDPLLRERIWTELRRLREAGRTLLVTTQYIGEAEHCDRVALLAEGRLIAVDTPAGLRREALGGEVIELESAAPVDAAALGGLPAVRVLRQRGPRDLLAVTDDAASATPTILDALRDRGVEVVASREYRPPFDQVFAELVSRSRPGGARDADAQGTWEREGVA